MKVRDIEKILKLNVYPAICCLPKDVLTLKRFNTCSLRQLFGKMTTFHCYRFSHFLVRKIFHRNFNSEKLLLHLYTSSISKSTNKFHCFYLVVFLCVIYFKKTCYRTSRKILKLFQKIDRLCRRKHPFQELYIVHSKNKSCIFMINDHVEIKMSELQFQSRPMSLSKKFSSLKRMIDQMKNREWITDVKTFQMAKSLCNFAFRFPTSNRLLSKSKAHILSTELSYPKPWLDFAFSFKQKIIDDVSSRRNCFRAIKTLLTQPFETTNLSFSHYITDILNILSHVVNNKILTLNKPGCFCHTKCLRDEERRETLYSNGMFILCKTCCQPVNYKHKAYAKAFVTNDTHNHANYFACADGCSQFNIIDLYDCFIDEKGIIKYKYSALWNVHKQKRQSHFTTICQASRTCVNLVTVEEKENGSKHKFNCGCNSRKQSDTCFDDLKEQITNNETFDISKFINEMCSGCIIRCFDICDPLPVRYLHSLI